LYDPDFKTYVGTGIKAIFVNSEWITLDIFFDEPPADTETLRANADPSRSKIVDRRILARFMIDKESALLLSEKLRNFHRLMSGPPPEVP